MSWTEGQGLVRTLVRAAWEPRSTEHAEEENRKNLFLACSVCSVLRMSQGSRSRCGAGQAAEGGLRWAILSWVHASRAFGSQRGGSQ